MDCDTKLIACNQRFIINPNATTPCSNSFDPLLHLIQLYHNPILPKTVICVAVAVLSSENLQGQLGTTTNPQSMIQALIKKKSLHNISPKPTDSDPLQPNQTWLITPLINGTQKQQKLHQKLLLLAENGGFTPQSLWDFWKYMQTLSDTEVTEKCVAIGEWGVEGLAKALEGLLDKEYLKTIDRPYWQPEPSTPHYHVVGHLRER